MNTPRCPDKETLFGYVVGTITEDVAEAVAQHLLTCRVCEQTIEALEGLSDTVVSALQQAAPRDAYAEEPACQQVLQQLQALRVGGPDIDRPLASASPPQPSPSRSRLGDYELLKKLGQGGMGTVYQAQHVRLKRVVALKVLPQNRLGNTDAVARFEREIEAVGRLDDPHIVSALDAREVDGVRFLVMEHVDGLDLAEVVARCGPLSVADACEVTRQAALGLQCSEEHGLVHRDIKPSNLMLNAEGQIKVLDLGLAQFQEAETLESGATGIGQLMGTPDYISPEQAQESHAVDIRTDIYSLGGTLYYLLAGQPPFSGSQYDTAMKKVAGHLRDAVPPIHVVRPDLPKPLVALLERMLAKNVSQRVARPSDVVSALAPLCAGSKLIGLLRTARAKAKQAEDEPSHQEAEGLQVCAGVNAIRDELAPRLPPDEPAAAADFNPYHRWLGIAPAEQPADHYRLLGIPRFESDPEVIRDAATRQMSHVRKYDLGPHSELSQNILNQLGMAKACLLDPQKKAVYDAECRKKQTAEVLEAPMPPAPPAPGQELAALVTDPDQGVEGSPAVERPRVDSSRRHRAPRDRWIQQVIRGLRTPAGVAVVAAGFLTVFLLGVVIRVQTNYGTVRIEIPPGINNVDLKLDGKMISLAGLDHPLRLRPGAHELLVTSKDYETVCNSFTVRRGNNPPLTVTLDAKTPLPVPVPKAEPVPEPESVVELIEQPVAAPVMPPPSPTPVSPQPTPQNLPTLQEIFAGDPIPWIGPLVAQCRKAVQEQDWELAQQCSARLLAAARRGVQERTLAHVTLLCQGLRRDVRFAHNPPDAYIEPFLQGLDTPGAFAADVGPPKTDPPNPVDHDRISKEVQQNYGPEYRKAQTEQQKKVFAEGILNAARSTTDPKDPATRFVLLEWVSHVAAEAKDWDLGGEAIEARAAEFQGVDVLSGQWQLCDALATVNKDPQEQRRLARQLLSFAHAALDEDRLELAQQFLGEAKRVAVRAKDRGFATEVQPIDKLMETIATERQLAQSAIRTLERDPLDAAANEQVGRFYCLTMGQWNRGLPWLALGSDQRLRDLAVQELGLMVDPLPPPSVAVRRKLAEDWSAVAESEKGRAHGIALGRAYRWYREVLRDVTGPDKNIIRTLLQDMRETGDLIVSAPDDAKPFCGHFYKAFPTPMPWHIASRECAELGGHLARLESPWENRFVWQLVSGPDFWRVDGSDVLAEGVWIFGNGEPATFTNWAQGQPENGGWMFSEHSIGLFPPDGKWSDLESDTRAYFICEWDGRLMRILPTEIEPPIRRPPRNAVAFGGHHYLLFEQPQIPWHVAQDFCARQGGHLARIQSPEEFEFLKTLIAQTKSTVFWVDGNDEESEGVWVDADGEPLTYLPWEPGFPSNDLGNENVAEIRDGKFNDMRCGLRQGGFISEWDR